MTIKKQKRSAAKKNTAAPRKQNVVAKSAPKFEINDETRVCVTFFEQGRLRDRIRIQGEEIIPPTYHQVSTTTMWSSEAIKFFISDAGRPKSCNSSKWKILKPYQRLEENVKWSADGRKYEFSILN